MTFLRKARRIMKIKEIYDYLDTIAPFSTAAEWDNCGLSVGSLDIDVDKVLIALDVTDEVIETATREGAELVITHHPLLFNPVAQIETNSLVYKAVKSGITFISSHTCLDKAVGGVNDCLARKVGIADLKQSQLDEFLKIGRIDPCTPEEFAFKVKNALGGKVSYTDSNATIKTVALCSGSGGDLIDAAHLEGADALLTGEAKHHEFLQANHLGTDLFVAGHYETEVIICEELCEILSRKFPDIEFILYMGQSPVKYI